jgi:hypothetical protein
MDKQDDKPTIVEFLDGEKTLNKRPRFPVPGLSDEALPVMGLLDDCMLTEESEPPMRSLGGWPVEIRAHEPILGMHELVSEEETACVTRLPPPRMPTLVRHNQWTLAFEIEKHVAFFRRIETKKGGVAEVPCSLPAKFVTGYLNFSASRLPLVAALATAPLVLSDGRVLAANGLDKKRGVVFRIPPEIADLAPKERVGGAAVEHAMKFLTDEWLVDVKTDYAGKCVLVALALTIIERPIFGERPAFFVTSGKRGGGKTTAINMIALATMGKRAPAMAWSRLEEERRKTIFSALLQGVPLIVFDNIARGAALTCPTVERAITASEIEDRVLGASRNEHVASTTPLAFTGNNILPKGDLASRALMARISVDRPDPENRVFAHPDPYGWTLDHRSEILEALYTVLVGNPRLYKRDKNEATRFKAWQRVIGSAIEHAANLAGMGMSFAKAFAAVEAEDEETASLAEAMERLDKLGKGGAFKSADAFQWASAENEDGKTLKAFLESSSGGLTARGIGHKLKAASDAPTIVGDAVWTLRAAKNPHKNLTEFTIEKARPAAD